jgi:hypothetical protein
LPATRKKPEKVCIVLAAAVLLDPQGRTLLVRPPEGDSLGAPEHSALFSRLWQFPAIARRVTPVERNRKSHGSVHRTANSVARHLSRLLEQTLGICAPPLEPLATVKHAVTFRDIRLVPFLVRVRRLPAASGARALPISEIDRLPVSSATRKIAACVARVLPAHYAG